MRCSNCGKKCRAAIALSPKRIICADFIIFQDIDVAGVATGPEIRAIKDLRAALNDSGLN